jgi:hypothetical protein
MIPALEERMRNAGRIVVEPWITHEHLDDQVIMINLETGAYFALEATAADCWSALVGGAAFDDIVSYVVRRYDVDESSAARDVDVFIDALTAEGLVQRSTEPTIPLADDGTITPRAAYRAPVIEKHDDLEELLLLDPIHDVGPEGWPIVN